MASIAQDILAFVGTSSVTGDEKALADLLEARLRQGPASRGSRVLRLGDSLVAAPEESPEDPRPLVVLAGHLDTVPQADAPEPFERDGRVHGRGAADMKGGLAVMLALAERLPAQIGFARRAFIFYTGEEGPAEGNALGEILDAQPWLSRADLAILLEPTDNVLELGCNGSIHVDVVFSGKACHSARPWTGRHPVAGALAWIDSILRYPVREAEIGGAIFREVATLTTIHAGDVRNVVPGTLRVNLNLRYAPDRTPESAERFALELSPPEAESRIADHSPAGRVDLDAPLYRHLCETTGLPRRAKQGWTDVARFTAAGVPALNWGPADPALCHTRDEHIDIAAAERCLHDMTAYFMGVGPCAPGAG